MPEATSQSSIRYWVTQVARERFLILSRVAVKSFVRPAINAGVERLLVAFYTFWSQASADETGDFGTLVLPATAT